MAKAHKASDPNLIERYGGQSGRKLVAAVRKSGQYYQGGSVYHPGFGPVRHIKAGLTVEDVRNSWEAKHPQERTVVTSAGALHGGPIVSEDKAKARLVARDKAHSAAIAAKEAKLAKEAELKASGGVEAVATHYLEATARWRGPNYATPNDPEANYVYVMARFHGGASSANLHGPMVSVMRLPGDVTAERKSELDAMADRLAIKYYKSDMRAALVWNRALGG